MSLFMKISHFNRVLFFPFLMYNFLSQKFGDIENFSLFLDHEFSMRNLVSDRKILKIFSSRVFYPGI